MATAGSVVVNLIANTANFTRGMNTASKKLSGFERSFRSVKSTLTAGAIGYTVKGVADGFTEVSKALRSGEDALYAFARALPVVGAIAESFYNLYLEIGGVNKQLEETAVRMEILTGINSVKKSRETMTPLEKELAIYDEMQKKQDELIQRQRMQIPLSAGEAALYDQIKKETGRDLRLEREERFNRLILVNIDALKRQAKEYWDLMNGPKFQQSEKSLLERLMQDPPKIKDPLSEESLMERLTDMEAADRALERSKPLFSNFGGDELQPMEPFRPEAREIDTSRVSIAGLAMSGRETVLTETKKQTNLLQDISRNTRKIANEEVLN